MAEEEIAGPAPTGGTGGGNGGCVVSDGPDVVVKPFIPAGRGVLSDVARGAD